MGPEAILLSVRDDGREGSYRFTCPGCADDVEKRADRKIVALLVSAGVDIAQPDGSSSQAAMLFDDADAERATPLGPVFTIDDVIEFHFLLQDDRYIQDFFASSDGV
jgi:hypothetical protein